MNLKAAIVEDEPISASLLQSFLNKFSKENRVSIDVDVFLNELDFINNYQKGIYSVIFMDIEMPHMDGITLSKKLREKDTEVILIFVTNMSQLAIKGYEVNALDFIVKPVEYSSFSMKMKRVLRYVRRDNGKRITLNVPIGIISVSSLDICYAEVRGHRLTFHTINDSFMVRKSLGDLEELLEGQPFYRCNSCYLVNLKYVSKAVGNTVTVNGIDLQISKPRHKEFLKELADYLGGGSK